MKTATKFLGTTDDVTTCDCCGRKDLKSTVALDLGEGDQVYYGVTCAARALALPPAYIRAASRKADRAKADAKARADRQAWDDAQAPWFAFLAIYGSGSDTFRRIESLGGYKAARASFETVTATRAARQAVA